MCSSIYSADKDSRLVYEVVEFSSQYGAGSAYSANNICGMPRIYPKHVDSSLAFSFLNYGPWYKLSPQGRAFPVIDSKRCLLSNEFVDLTFADQPNIKNIKVFETYNPGAISCIRMAYLHSPKDCLNVRVLKWKTLWKTNENEKKQFEKKIKSNIFDCPIPYGTPKIYVLRLEFNCERVPYFTQLDACRVTLMDSAYDEQFIKNNEIVEMDGNALEDEIVSKEFFTRLQFQPEIAENIFQYLTWKDLCRFSCVSSYCYDLVNQYIKNTRELNLQFVWSTLNEDGLKIINQRFSSSGLQRLDLSWTGCYNCISSEKFLDFLDENNFANQLISLNLQNCDFIKNDSLKELIEICPNLQHLNLSACTKVTYAGFEVLTNLQSLTWLGLYRTQIKSSTLVNIIRSCPNLAHLNIADCHCNVDDLIVTLAQLQPKNNIRSLNLWRNEISTRGLTFLADGFDLLEELNIGYCCDVNLEPGQLLYNIITHCKHLQKLDLTKYAKLSHNDLNAICDYLSELEQLIIVGVVVDANIDISNLLNSCRKLKLLDVSFVENVSLINVFHLQQQFPSCTIHKSVPLYNSYI